MYWEVGEDENSYSVALQNDLNALDVWCKMWQLNLNEDKCLVMRISCRKERSVSTYSLDGVLLVPVNSVKYLGILITSDLWWNDHIRQIVGLASHRLCFVWRLYRNCPETVKETGYTTLVRSHLEYCAPVCCPHLVTQILAVDMVQPRAARFIKGNFQWTANVTEMLRSLHWDTLRSRRETWAWDYLKDLIWHAIPI